MRIHLSRFVFFLFLAAAVVLAWLKRDQPTPETVAALVERRRSWGPVVFVGISVLAPVLFLPGAMLTLAEGRPLGHSSARC